VRYAKAGGTLLVLGASGNKDQYGLTQRQIPLAQPLGNGQYPATEVTRRVGKGQVQFIPLRIPPSRFLIPMKSHGDYTTFGPTMGDIFADIPEAYTRNHIDPELRKLLERVADKVRESLGTRVTRLTSAAPFVEITTMTEKTDRWMILHVVNYDVTVDGTITPARDLKVQVAIPRGKIARSVTWSGTLAEMKPLKYTTVNRAGGQTLMLDLNEINIYGLAKIELE
jgi:hypothetical protein